MTRHTISIRYSIRQSNVKLLQEASPLPDFKTPELLETTCFKNLQFSSIMTENGIQKTEDVQELCYEALSELYPGG